VCGGCGCVVVTVDGCAVEVEILDMARVEGELVNFCAFEVMSESNEQATKRSG
jgi:hypothetical protein